CELDDPHYWFSSEKMKIIPDDKVIAKGIRFHILGIPIPPRLFTIPGLNFEVLPSLPFIIKSIRSGRQSGLLMPQYSNNPGLTGITLKGLGYYWAPSDYFDARVIADFTQKVGVIVRGRVRYKWRYLIDGNIETTYNRDSANGILRWETRFNHSQTIDPTLRISARGNFSSSSDFNTSISDDLERRLQRVLRSNANLSKRFSNGSNLSVALSQTNFLDKGITDTQLPAATYRISRRPLFGNTGQSQASSGPGGLTGFGFSTGGTGERALPRWYENFYIDYNLSLRSLIRNELQDMGTAAERDSITQQGGMEQKANLTYSGKVFGWLNLQPNFSAQEAWYFGDTARDGFQRRFLWNSSLRASTKIYGMLDHPFRANVAFRHVVEPSISLNYAPDFSDLDEVPSLFGGIPGSRQNLSYSLNQIFQMKRWVGEEERQTELARIATSGSYNARANGRKLSDINTSLITKVGNVLNLQLRTLHSLYEPDTDMFRTKPIMLSASYRSSIRLDSATVAGLLGRKAGTGEDEEDEPESGQLVETPETDILEEEVPFGVPTRDAEKLRSSNTDRDRAGGGSWNLAVSHNYSWRRSSEVPTHSLDGSLTVNVPKWTLSVQSRYDFAPMELVRMSFSIYRDLHCWEARLQVVPTGPGKGYWFMIAIKEIPEIKYERRRTEY
ncbi:putative LPS assembly protein LptD, partial [Gemmatimonadota bacterium]